MWVSKIMKVVKKSKHQRIHLFDINIFFWEVKENFCKEIVFKFILRFFLVPKSANNSRKIMMVFFAISSPK